MSHPTDPPRLGPGRPALLLCVAILLGSTHLPGCGSGGSGSQVEVTEEAKAQIQSRRDTYGKMPKKAAPSSKKPSRPSR